MIIFYCYTFYLFKWWFCEIIKKAFGSYLFSSPIERLMRQALLSLTEIPANACFECYTLGGADTHLLKSYIIYRSENSAVLINGHLLIYDLSYDGIGRMWEFHK